MSENTTAPAKTEAKAAAKTEAKTDTKTSTESTTSESSSTETSTPKKSSPPAREISYFSSVSSNEYRAGWEGIFSKGKNKSIKKAAEPVTIELSNADLSKELRAELKKALRKKAKKDGVKSLKTTGLTWRIECDVLSA